MKWLFQLCRQGLNGLNKNLESFLLNLLSLKPINTEHFSSQALFYTPLSTGDRSPQEPLQCWGLYGVKEHYIELSNRRDGKQEPSVI